MRNSGQRTRIEAHVAAEMSAWSQAYENAATEAWRAVMRLTPEAARQERQAIAEMIERLEWLKESYDAMATD